MSYNTIRMEKKNIMIFFCHFYNTGVLLSNFPSGGNHNEYQTKRGLAPFILWGSFFYPFSTFLDKPNHGEE